MRLKGKVALITGAGSGMGRAASVLFAREGAKVAAIDVTEASAAETARMIKSSGGDAISLRADVSDSEDARAMVEETVRAFGGLDVLYNNAGIEGESGFIAQLSEEAFDRVIAINLRGVWLGMKYGLPRIVERGGGAVINTASVAGIVGHQGRGRVLRGQGRRDLADASRGARVRALQRPRQLHLPGSNPHSDGGSNHRTRRIAAQIHPAQFSAWPRRQRRRNRAHRAVPRQRRSTVRHRRSIHYRRRLDCKLEKVRELK